MTTEIKINGKVYGVFFGNRAISECENRFGFSPLTLTKDQVADPETLYKIVFCGILNFYRKEPEKAISWEEFDDAQDAGLISFVKLMECLETFGKSQVVSNFVEFGKHLESESKKKKKK